jgi:alpha-glucosidase (family GH31 glycosyl hydrolase)
MWIPYDLPMKELGIVRDILQLRASLMPYLYTQARKTFDTGLAFLRPLYYDFPNEDMAYKCLTLVKLD